MTTPVISGDGIFSHVFIGAADVENPPHFTMSSWARLVSITSARLAMAGYSMVAKSQHLSLPVRATVKHLPLTG
jgi:hypothetical protein